MNTMLASEILDCGHAESPHDDHTRGYATSDTGETYCYDCAAERELSAMMESGRGLMYVSSDKQYVTNWTGRNPFKILGVRPGAHNFAGYQIHFWVRIGREVWHGIQWGNRPDLSSGYYCRLYRTKQTV